MLLRAATAFAPASLCLLLIFAPFSLSSLRLSLEKGPNCLSSPLPCLPGTTQSSLRDTSKPDVWMQHLTCLAVFMGTKGFALDTCCSEMTYLPSSIHSPRSLLEQQNLRPHPDRLPGGGH